ncbi:MAG: Ig-like domain-containing protein [Duncaniella sp.]|nr:Ig-like domain-containing protein [Duncaniella sp.]
MKRLYLFLVCLMISFYSVLSAQTTFTVDYMKYTVTDEENAECSLTGTTLSSGAIVIPATVEYSGVTYSVKSIGSKAFNSSTNKTKFTSLSIAEGITEIMSEAFSGCTAIASELNLPSTLTTLGDKAFYGCTSLSGDLILPQNLSSIGAYAFYNCSALTGTFDWHDNLTIGDNCFYGCTGLTGEIVVPETVTTIPSSAFYKCTGFTKLVMHNGITSIGSSAFYNCSGLTGELVLPANVTTINSYCFYGCSGLTGTLVIPENVTTIDRQAFYQCTGFTGLELPEGLRTIGYQAFQFCTGMYGDLTLPSTLECVGSGAFCRCSFTGALILPESTTFDTGVFNLCTGFTSLTLPKNMTSIPNTIFSGCSGLTGTLEIPATVTEIGNNAFAGTGYTGTLVIPDAVTSLGTAAFNKCVGLKRIKFGKNLKTIGASAFAECTGLTNVVKLPASLSQVNFAAFNACANVKKFINPSNTPCSADSRMFYGVAADSKLYVPSGSESLYDAATGWSAKAPAQPIVTCQKIEIELPDPSIAIGSIKSLTVKFTPADTTDDTVWWESSDPEVASIDDDGYLSALKLGTTTLTAVSGDGNVTSLTLTVTPPAAEAVTLNSDEAELYDGETFQLQATVLPDNASDKSVKWTSSDEDVASVDDTGLVTALKPGESTVTATTVNGLSATCKITVIPVSVSGLTITPDKVDVTEGLTVDLTAVIEPHNATDKTITWTSSNTAVATVDNGTVTAVTPGNATITATANGINATCEITVVEVSVEPESITLNSDKAELVEGESLQLTATVEPDHATDKTVTWKSSNEDVATVGTDGLVTAIAKGSAIITATNSKGHSAECAITVISAVHVAESIELNSDMANITEGDTIELTATISPETTTDKTVSWTSSDPSVATVDENGVVTAVAEGSCTITATTSNGLSDSCAITVVKRVIEAYEITIDPHSALIFADEKLTPEVIFTPAETTERTISWTSSDESVATVDENGVITGISAGTATITATTGNGLTSDCEITVRMKPVEPTQIEVSFEAEQLTEGEDVTLKVTFTPDDTTETTVMWSSSDETVATVDENGVVTAVGPGTATITATTLNGLTATCEVTVSAPTTGIDSTDSLKTTIVTTEGSDIVIISAEPTLVYVYNTYGTCVAQSIENRISGLKPGIYIVIIDGSAIKIRI